MDDYVLPVLAIVVLGTACFFIIRGMTGNDIVLDIKLPSKISTNAWANRAFLTMLLLVSIVAIYKLTGGSFGNLGNAKGYIAIGIIAMFIAVLSLLRYAFLKFFKKEWLKMG